MAKRNDPAHVVAGAGYLTSLFTKLSDAVEARGGTAEDMHRLCTDDGNATIIQMAELIVATRQYPNLRQEGPFDVVADYTQSRPDQIEAGNFHTYVNSDVVSIKIEATDKVDRQLVLVNFGQTISDTDATSWAEANGFCRPDTTTALAFAASSDAWNGRWVVGTGAVWSSPGDGQCAAVFDGDGGDRRLNLYFVGDDWGSYYWFLFACK